MTQYSQTRTTEHKKNLPNSQLIEIERTFQAPVSAVWKAWSEPELMKQWWGPVGFSCPEASIDFRIGGQCLLAMKDDKEGKIFRSVGTYLEIVPEEKIVCTDSFADEKGNIIPASELGMTGDWPKTCYITLEFADVGEQTKLLISHEGIPKEQYSDCIQGWNSSLDKLQRLVEKN